MADFASFVPESKKSLLQKTVKVFDDFLQGLPTSAGGEWKGYKFNPGFSVDTARYAYEEWEDIKEDSVFLIAYQKTGTHWTGEVLRQILFSDKEDTDKISKMIPMPLSWLESSIAEKFELMKYVPLPRQIFTTHLNEDLINVEKIRKKRGKFIYVMRNPKDQAVSWFHFTKTAPLKPSKAKGYFQENWSEFLDDYVQGKQMANSKDGEWYLDHIKGWYKYKDEKDFLVFYFEDMKSDPKATIKRIAKFLGKELSETDVDRIADASSFKSMKKTAEGNLGGELDKARKKIGLLRKGEVGNWKSYFTVAQSEMMDRLVEKYLGDTDIKFTYQL